jgi:HTH-type transcriptional regulator/antitoxin HigA
MTSKEYIQKTKRMEELLKLLTEKGQLNKKQEAELDQVSELIADYEESNFPFQADTLIEMIELRMFQRKLKQKDIAKILNTTPSRVSEILNGKRGLTFDLAKALYTKLNIDPKIILGKG